MTWSIVGKTEDEKTRLQALALINDVNKYRTELVTNGVIVNDSLQIIQSKMEHLNGNGKGKGTIATRYQWKTEQIVSHVKRKRNNYQLQTVSLDDLFNDHKK